MPLPTTMAPRNAVCVFRYPMTTQVMPKVAATAARQVASQFHAEVVLLNGLADAGAQVAVDTRVLDVATGAMLGFASAGVTKDAKVQRMLETGRQ